MKITDNLSLVASGALSLHLTHESDCNAYLLEGREGSILIDGGTGLDPEETFRLLDRHLRKPLTWLLVTHHHADHIGGLAGIQRRFGGCILVPEGERQSIEAGDERATGLDIARAAGYYPPDYHIAPCPVQGSVRPGQTLTLAGEEITVYSAAGHSPGGVCYLFPEYGMLFSGDLVMRGGCINLQNIPGADLRAYAESVQTLAQAEFTQFFPGHGCFSLKGGRDHVRAAAEQFRRLAVPRNFI